MFQSTPAIADGRTLITHPFVFVSVVFQSTPAIADGRTPAFLAYDAYLKCFNPRPPSLTGEPAGLGADVVDGLVSIHARHR